MAVYERRNEKQQREGKFQNGEVYQGEFKIVLEKEKEFINIQMGLFMKASIKIV